MYLKHLTQAGHTRRFEISERSGGWDVRTLADSEIVKHAHYDDWHRVERAMLTFRLEISSLESAGWVAE